MSGVPPGVSLRAGVTISPEAAARIDDLEAADVTDEASVTALTARVVVLETAALDFESRIAALEAP